MASCALPSAGIAPTTMFVPPRSTPTMYCVRCVCSCAHVRESAAHGAPRPTAIATASTPSSRMQRQCPSGQRCGPCRSQGGRQARRVPATMASRRQRTEAELRHRRPEDRDRRRAHRRREMQRRRVVGHEQRRTADQLGGREQRQRPVASTTPCAPRTISDRRERPTVRASADDRQPAARREPLRELRVVRPALRRPHAARARARRAARRVRRSRRAAHPRPRAPRRPERADGRSIRRASASRRARASASASSRAA